MIAAAFQRKKQSFIKWWRAPVTRKDRLLGAVVGGMGLFWVGVLGRIILGPTPVSLGVLAYWALGCVTVGVALGILFPKATTCIAFPLSTFGVGGGP
jgi:hypothetical protein